MTEKQTRSQTKRLAIIDAALKEFREKGFRATSMDALSARANVSKRTVYNHFDSKEMLFKEIIQQLFETGAQNEDHQYNAHEPLADQLLQFAVTKMELLQSQHFLDVSKIMVAECIYSPELTLEALHQANSQEQGLQGWIKSAIEDKRLRRVDPNYAAGQFMGLIKTNAFWPQLLMSAPFPSENQRLHIAQDTVAMFLNHYQL